MRKILFILVFCLASLSIFATNYKVLFLGNSYTEVNNLPQLVYTVSLSTGDTITFTSSTPGGCTFQQHLTVSSSLIQQGGWDYVVLQEQSQLPAFPITQFMAESYPYAQQLCQMISQYNPQAQVVFYMTWGRKNGDAQNAPAFPPIGTYEGMDSLLHARYMLMAEDNDAIVSPVGALWHFIRHNHPDIELYSSDESHPSLAGSYAAACSFYTIFFQKDPTLIHADAGVDPAMAQTIRQAAKQVVFDSLSTWMFLNDDSVAVSEPEPLQISVFPNPTVQFMHVKLSRPDVVFYNISIYNKQGVLIQQYLNIEESDHLLDLSTLDEGLYMIEVETADHEKIIKKFIKSL